MPINAYLNFDGNTREAVLFYARTFGLEEPQIMTFGDTPADPNYPLPEEAKNRVMHARLEISGSTVMFSDSFPGQPFTQGNNFSLALVSADQEELKAAYAKLSDGGQVVMELQETFWSKLYGSVKDKFGVEWQFSHDDGSNVQ